MHLSELEQKARVATWARRMRRLGIVMLVLVGLGPCAWLVREPMLRGAVALRKWADGHGTAALIIPTEVFGARRVRWMFHREFAGCPAYEHRNYRMVEDR